MSNEEFHTITIPWKGPDNTIIQEEVLLKKELTFGDFTNILTKGGFNIETKSVNNIQAFMIGLLQATIKKAPFDPKQVENILGLPTSVAWKIFQEALSLLPLGDLGVLGETQDSHQKPQTT